MEQKLLITEKENHILSAFVEDKRIVRLSAEAMQPSLLGNIYIGKVQNIVKNINAAFVEFSKGQMGYLPLEEVSAPIRTNARNREDSRILVGDEILVQVIREAVKTKPPTLSCTMDLSGKYLVLVIGRQGISISKKIRDKKERARLQTLLLPHASEAYEIIARTDSACREEEVILSEFAFLKKKAEKLLAYSMHQSVFSKLYEEAPMYLKALKNSNQTGTLEVLTDSPALYQNILTYIEENQWTDRFSAVMWKEEDGRLSSVYNLDRTLEHALRKKVWLKSGAYLVIEPTEALVSIDVNTGKAVTKKKDVEKHFLKINIEAAIETALQLKLRNLSGIIIVDFIDMKTQEAREELLTVFRKELAKDPVPTTLVDMTKLGLVEVTRKKTSKPLYEELA